MLNHGLKKCGKDMIDLESAKIINKLFGVLKKNENRGYLKSTDIGKIFEPNKIKIKQDIVSALENTILDECNTIGIFCSSYGFSYVDHFIENGKKVTFYDMCNIVLELAETYYGKHNKLFSKRFQDVWTLQKSENHDLNLFMACEHLPPMKYYTNYKQGYYLFTSTDFDGIKDHNNCPKTLQEFEDQMYGLLDIIHTEENYYEGYGKQFTIIGEIC